MGIEGNERGQRSELNDHIGTTRRKFLLASSAGGITFLAGCTTDGAADGFAIEKAELTQAIQHIDDPDEPENSLPVVRGKRTFLRVYPSSDQADEIDGILRVFVDGSEIAGSPFASENGPISPPSSVDREVTDHTLNFHFLVPRSGFGAAGAVDVDLVVEVDNGEDPDDDAYEEDTMEMEDVTFECHRSPSIAYVPIDYTFDGEDDPDNTGLPETGRILPGIGDDFLWHTFPIPEPPNYYPASVPDLEWDDELDFSTATDLINELETTRNMLSPEPDFIYGWLPGNPIGYNGAALGNAAFGNTEETRYQRTFAHEIGHLLGLEHPNRDLDPEVGFFTSDPVHEIRTDNCDSTGDERTKCGSLADVMVPGNLTSDAWIDPETYRHLANQDEIADHTCPGLVFPNLENPLREYRLVTGTIARTEDVGSHSLNPTYRLEGRKELTEPDREGDQRIVLRDEDGNELFSHDFEVSFLGPGGDSGEPLDESAFSLALPTEFDADVASVVLISEGDEVDRIERSPTEPAVEIASPAPGDTLDGETAVRWDAADKDTDSLLFSVRYSPDDGETFVPLTVNSADSAALFDTADIPGSRPETGLIQVIATDGFNTTVEQVSGLTVPDRKPPMVRITEPKPHGGHEDDRETQIEHRQGTPLVLTGYGYDMEDGFLREDSLQWESSIEDTLGTGQTIQVTDLSPGEHTITLVGLDSDENGVEDSITVTIVE